MQAVYSAEDFKTVPFERPVELGERKYLTDEEYAKRVQGLQKQLQDDQAPTFISRKTGDLGQGNFGYWQNHGKPQRQTSVVIDPPNGRIPYLDGKRPPVGPRQASARGTPINSPEELGLLERCISAGVPWAIIRDNENNTVRIIQASARIT